MFLAFSLLSACNAILHNELRGSLLQVFNVYLSVSFPSLAIPSKNTPNCLFVPLPYFFLSSSYYMASLCVFNIYVYTIYGVYRVGQKFIVVHMENNKEINK